MVTDKSKITVDIDTNNKFLVDWFSFTTKVYDLNELFIFLGLQDIISSFNPIFGVGFYKKRLYFGGINIHYASENSSNIGTIWVEMSGHGCRTFETYSKISFFELFSKIYVDNARCDDLNSKLNKKRKNSSSPLEVYTPDYNVTRLDVAYDDFKKLIPLKKLSKKIIAGEFVSKFNSKSIYSTIKPGYTGITCMLGSPTSDIRFRVYDKASERGYDDEIQQGFTWARWEMQLRDKSAFNYISSVVKDSESVGSTFKGVLLNYFRVVDVNKNDSNKRRWKMSGWYSKFIGDVERISLFTPCKAEYNLSKCENYVYKIAGNAVYTLIEIKGVEKFIEELKTQKAEIKPKYQDLINESNNNLLDFSENKVDKLFSDEPEFVPFESSHPELYSSSYIWKDIHDIEICEECGNVVSADDDFENIYLCNGRLLCYHCYQNEFHRIISADSLDTERKGEYNDPERDITADELHIQHQMSVRE